MAIIKKIVAGKMETLNSCDDKSCSCRCSFKKGTRFSMDNANWVVSEEKVSDEIEYRTVTNIRTGDTEVYKLDLLVQYTKDGTIVL